MKLYELRYSAAPFFKHGNLTMERELYCSEDDAITAEIDTIRSFCECWDTKVKSQKKHKLKGKSFYIHEFDIPSEDIIRNDGIHATVIVRPGCKSVMINEYNITFSRGSDIAKFGNVVPICDKLLTWKCALEAYPESKTPPPCFLCNEKECSKRITLTNESTKIRQFKGRS